jgi:hypothetical protein
MQLISDEYRKLNEGLHETNKKYGVSGAVYLQHIVNLVKAYQTQDILDYGCGKSTLANNLPFIIKQYDPAVPKYSEMPKPAHIVVCTDVLEHIEPECLDNVLDHIRDLTRKVAFLVIATRHAQKTLADGRNAHLIVKPARWWLAKLYERFDIRSFETSDEACVATVRPL